MMASEGTFTLDLMTETAGRLASKSPMFCLHTILRKQVLGTEIN